MFTVKLVFLALLFKQVLAVYLSSMESDSISEIVFCVLLPLNISKENTFLMPK